MGRRVFLIVLDSFGIGGAPDAAAFGDEGSDTLAAIARSEKYHTPHLNKLGLFNIDGVALLPKEANPAGAYGRLVEKSDGKDTTVGHWEIAGIESRQGLPVFPNGFPTDLMARFEKLCGRGTLCNKPYSGTVVIRDFGQEHIQTGKLIVYTSADSVFQIAAHEEVVPPQELYRYCEMAREMLVGDWAVGRVIARPFTGTAETGFARMPNRHDYSLRPPAPTVLQALCAAQKQVIGVGKIHDIFAGQGVTETIPTRGNAEGIETTLALTERDFEGLVFVNLVDFDMVYGHRNNVDGYAEAISVFDKGLGELLPKLQEEDMVMLCADHGCDPSTPSTDHSRECVPFLAAGPAVKQGVNLGTQPYFSCIANTIAEYFQLPAAYPGKSFWAQLRR